MSLRKALRQFNLELLQFKHIGARNSYCMTMINSPKEQYSDMQYFINRPYRHWRWDYELTDDHDVWPEKP